MRILFTLKFIAIVLFVQAQTGIVINEFVASSDSIGGISDSEGGYPDWIELHNLDDATVNLAGYMVSDNYTIIDKFVFPAGSFIEANGYVVIWADKDLEDEGYHADFRLQAEGERIILSDPNGGYLDSIGFGQQETNVAMARIPNGTGDFTFRAPTFSANNETTAIIEPDFIEEVAISPNPTAGFLSYEYIFNRNYEKKSTYSLRVYDLYGKFVTDLEQYTSLGGNSLSGVADLRYLSNGFYFIKLQTDNSILTRKFLLQK
ncbi:MAG: hypothetical protein ACI85O_001400 [Saprospiraceae bacterium]|jgi:hypothetical protein